VIGPAERHPDLDAWLDDEPSSEAERSELLAHLVHCAACRDVVGTKDPSRLFGLLALEPVPPVQLDRLAAAVEEALEEHEEHEASGSGAGAVPAPRRVRWLPAASLAASLVLAGLLATYVSRRDAAQQTEPRAVAARPAVPTTAPGFELLSSPGEARVVDLAVGEVQLVMIFDEELDL
jgi:hypothetical protein